MMAAAKMAVLPVDFSRGKGRAFCGLRVFLDITPTFCVQTLSLSATDTRCEDVQDQLKIISPEYLQILHATAGYSPPERIDTPRGCTPRHVCKRQHILDEWSGFAFEPICLGSGITYRHQSANFVSRRITKPIHQLIVSHAGG